jgi:hypothetical protein
MLNTLWPFVSKEKFNVVNTLLQNTRACEKYLSQEAKSLKESVKFLEKEIKIYQTENLKLKDEIRTQNRLAQIAAEQYRGFRDHILKFYGKDALQKRNKGRFTGETF